MARTVYNVVITCTKRTKYPFVLFHKTFGNLFSALEVVGDLSKAYGLYEALPDIDSVELWGLVDLNFQGEIETDDGIPCFATLTLTKDEVEVLN